MKLKLNFDILSKMKLSFDRMKQNFNRKTFFDKVAGEGKLKLYDDAESMAMKCLIITSSMHDTFQGKYNKKKQVIQVVVIISMWMAIFFWMNGFINSQTHKDPSAFYNVYYYGNGFGQDEISLTAYFMSLILLGNCYHLISKLV